MPPEAAAATASPLAAARRVVVKIGSALLVDGTDGRLRGAWLNALAADLADLKAAGAEVLVVSSGAIALGRAPLGLGRRTLTLEESQAAAAVGQLRLAHAWQEALAGYQVTVAQVLLTADDTEQRRRYLNGRSTLQALLARGAVPVINENDTVATEEIRFGDNDRLAARVAAMIGADCLLLLSDIDGLYSGDPGTDPQASFIPEVHEISPDIEAMAGVSRSGMGKGGMVTKLQAARIALQAGCHMAIAAGQPLHPVAALKGGGRGTWFLSPQSPTTARKRWIAGSLRPQGAIVVDDGAARALRTGKSLLPAGVRDVEGRFQRGDAVLVRDGAGAEVARGLVAYSTDDARRIMGRNSREIAAILGFRGRAEMIHRDDMVLS